MKPPLLYASVFSIVAGAPAFANDPPLVEHQPAQCSVLAKPIELCASVLDDGDIAKVRTYFRRPGEKEYLVSEMAFEGARFCTTLPGVKAGKLRSLEYYIQAVDTEYESKRTSTYQLQMQTEEECAFPAVQKDRRSPIIWTPPASPSCRWAAGRNSGAGPCFQPAGPV
jgi:hypothetical protein